MNLKLILIFFAIAALFGCGGPAEVEQTVPETARLLTDDLGRSVILPQQVDRAVSLAPSITETVFAAGAGERLVGVTTFCDFPAQAKEIKRIGDTQTPNIETIIALRPQVVLVTTASQVQAAMPQFEERGIQVFVMSPDSVDAVIRSIRQVGEIFGTSGQAELKAAELERRLAALNGSGDAASRPGVFVQISKEPLFTVGKDSFITEIIELAGGRSVTAEVATAYPKLSKETALVMDPDVIILSASDDNREPNPVFASSPAARNGRVYSIDADILSRPGPRVADAVEEAARLIALAYEDKN